MSLELDAIYKLLMNKQVTDPATGLMTIYDDDDTTVLYSGNVYEDALAATLYRGMGIDRREKLASGN